MKPFVHDAKKGIGGPIAEADLSTSVYQAVSSSLLTMTQQDFEQKIAAAVAAERVRLLTDETFIRESVRTTAEAAQEYFNRLVAESASAEREACAKIAERTAAEVRAAKDHRDPECFVPIAEVIADRIRKQGQK